MNTKKRAETKFFSNSPIAFVSARIKRFARRVNKNISHVLLVEKKTADNQSIECAAVDIFHVDKELANDNVLRNLFSFFDQDCNGQISAEELRAIMLLIGEQLTEEEAQEMLKDADRNGDGIVDYSDFRDSICKILDQCGFFGS
ncbi:hypothetical protein GJ496_009047 [Pomphorhynchus laevis]|nr:hypothetical protein GJ496_009047 [Pomphorhynchus laevis]